MALNFEYPYFGAYFHLVRILDTPGASMGSKIIEAISAINSLLGRIDEPLAANVRMK